MFECSNARFSTRVMLTVLVLLFVLSVIFAYSEVFSLKEVVLCSLHSQLSMMNEQLKIYIFVGYASNL